MAELAAEEQPPKAEHAAEEKPPSVDVEEAHAETEDHQKPVAGTCHFAKASLFLYLLSSHKAERKVQTQDCSACFNLLSDQSETSCCHCDFSNGTWSFRDVLDADSSSSESIPT